MESVDETRLNQCLSSIIQKIDEVLKQQKKEPPQIRPTTTTTTDNITNYPLHENSIQNNNVNTFTIDNEEAELLNTLTNDIQNILRDSLPQLSELCSSYIEKHLYQYHFDSNQKVFTEGLTLNILYSFKHDLNGLLSAARAYPAALKGDLKTVETFLKRFPLYKDKPGFWGTTFLYSASKSNNLPLVKHLIETLSCSVNAQNECEMAFTLISDDNNRTDLTYNPDPKFASTALHAACFNNNLDIVKYLISKGANYFSRNQLGETPIQNGRFHGAIQNFFNDFLVTSYTNLPNMSLPNEPVLNCYDRKPTNCIWEYKPVEGLQWDEFTISEHHILSSVFVVEKNNQLFNPTTYLSSNRGTYNVNLLTFLRGGKNQEPNPSNQDSLAWIRCRGSSVAILIFIVFGN
ncbi:hypothetical protein I4U23_016987 [Adineta vaga]|nr:hypothetical protein I4U23_016987 [Adineta vaga]